MKIYAVAEHELTTISTMNNLCSIAFAVGMALITFAGGIYVTYLFTEHVPPGVEALTIVGYPAFAALGLVALIVSFWAASKRTGIWSQIRKESSDVVP